MKKKLVVGLVGGSGSGKSVLGGFLARRGVCVIDADAVAKRVMDKNESVLSRLETEFPDAFENGMLVRKKLAEICFSDGEMLKKLNAITHPAILSQIDEMIAKDDSSIAVVDAAALIESGYRCDVTVAVICPAHIRVKRITARDALSLEQAKQRIGAQLSDAALIKAADIVVFNIGGLNRLAKKAARLFALLSKWNEKTRKKYYI